MKPLLCSVLGKFVVYESQLPACQRRAQLHLVTAVTTALADVTVAAAAGDTMGAHGSCKETCLPCQRVKKAVAMLLLTATHP